MAKAQAWHLCACLVFAFGFVSQASAASINADCGGGMRDVHASPARLVNRLVYRDQSLADVAADLSRLGPHRVMSGPRAAKLRFSGVLAGSDQAGMTRKITQLVPVFIHCENGAVVLRVYP